MAVGSCCVFVRKFFALEMQSRQRTNNKPRYLYLLHNFSLIHVISHTFSSLFICFQDATLPSLSTPFIYSSFFSSTFVSFPSVLLFCVSYSLFLSVPPLYIPVSPVSPSSSFSHTLLLSFSPSFYSVI